MEVTAFCKECLGQFIKGVSGTSVSFNNISIISQFTNTISTQNEEAMEANKLCCQKIERTINKDKNKKDTTKMLHPSIVKMFGHASEKSSTDESEAISATCTHFQNSNNVEIAQYGLVINLKN
jgi:hypothetical protein